MIKPVAVLFILVSYTGFCQDRILSFGYSKNFIDKDSSNFAIQIDLNRIPGKTESAGSFYVVNTIVGKTPFGFYLKPTADINIGSYTTLAPNNISVGLPFGFSFDIPKFSPGLFSASLEFSPDFVGEKTFSQYLCYFSPGVVVNYSLVPHTTAEIIDIGAGIYKSYGKRMQSTKTKTTNKYQKITIPVAIGLSLFKNTAKNFHRLKFAGVYKYNHVQKDNTLITPNVFNSYVLLKLDYYFIKNLGVNFTFNSGREEPLFKRVKSLSFGITLAR
ncbi:MAG: hypothetical protein JWN83_2051 [Chitinophagaceae bacterium]|nr:hypothetical protein [Chitinophagaceae bacterium]